MAKDDLKNIQRAEVLRDWPDSLAASRPAAPTQLPDDAPRPAAEVVRRIEAFLDSPCTSSDQEAYDNAVRLLDVAANTLRSLPRPAETPAEPQKLCPLVIEAREQLIAGDFGKPSTKAYQWIDALCSRIEELGKSGAAETRAASDEEVKESATRMMTKHRQSLEKLAVAEAAAPALVTFRVKSALRRGVCLAIGHEPTGPLDRTWLVRKDSPLARYNLEPFTYVCSRCAHPIRFNRDYPNGWIDVSGESNPSARADRQD